MTKNNLLLNIYNSSLELISINSVFPHEEIELERVKKIADEIKAYELLKHPIPCVKTEKGYMVLDGHHRLMALELLGCKFVVVQEVEIADVHIEYWYHSISLEGFFNLSKIKFMNRKMLGFHSEIAELNINSTSVKAYGSPEDFHGDMWAIYNSYVETGYERRQTLPHGVEVNWIKYSGLDIEKLINLSHMNKKIPPGITRFIFPYRILNFDTPLSLLRSGDEKEWNGMKEKILDSQIHEVPVICVN